jgi:hypothetical protein
MQTLLHLVAAVVFRVIVSAYSLHEKNSEFQLHHAQSYCRSGRRVECHAINELTSTSSPAATPGKDGVLPEKHAPQYSLWSANDSDVAQDNTPWTSNNSCESLCLGRVLVSRDSKIEDHLFRRAGRN